MPTRKETVWFVALALLLSWAVGAWWLHDESHLMLVRLLMCVPAFVAIGCAWAFRREPPRAAGFAFTGWKPWLGAMAYPLAMIAACLLLAYGWRALGHPGFIVFQPEKLEVPVRPTLTVHGLGALPVLLALWAFYLLPWLFVAGAYRWAWADKLKAALPARWAWIHHVVRVLIFLPTLLLHGLFDGELGEEMGWRGYLVRRWVDRPLVAAAITMPVWASFHIPIIFSSTQKGHPVLNAVFLLSIAAAAVPFAAFYRWGRSVWPCAVLHLSWNLWNPIILGDVYMGHPGLFGGQVRIFNGEALFGLIFNGIVAAVLILKWRREAMASSEA